MKRLMSILIMLAIATSIYSESISEWWEALNREDRVKILQEYIGIKNAELVIDDIKYSCIVEGNNVKFIPVYPNGVSYYVATLDGLTYEVVLPEFTYKKIIPKKTLLEVAAPPLIAFTLGIIVGVIVSK